MLKMDRGAARSAAGRSNSRVVEVDELKRARERRASSARHPAEQDRDLRQEARRTPHREPAWRQEEDRKAPELMADDRPFWEKDSPFAEKEKPFWQQERQGRDGEEERQAPRRAASHRREAAEEPRPVRERKVSSRESVSQDSIAGRKTPPRRRQQGNAGLKALLMMLALLALTVVIGLKVFEIQDIEVKGAETITPDSVIALSGIAKGENIFKTSLTQARDNLESDPLVEVLGISRIFPDKIKIEIRQRQPHAALAWLDGYAVIDERGFALDVRDSLPAGQYPLVTGIDIEPAQKGEPIKGVEADRLDVMQKLLTALKTQGALPMISEINLADVEHLVMLTAEGLQIDMGRASELEMKAKWVAGTVPELRKQGYTTGVLYVTGAKGPVYSAAGTTASGQEGNEPAEGQQGEAEGNGTEGEGGPENAA